MVAGLKIAEKPKTNSVKIRLNSMAKRLFHISSIGNRKSILKDGLEPRSYNGNHIKYNNRLFLFSTIEDPPFDLLSHNDIDIWEVSLPSGINMYKDEIADKERGREGCFYIESKISKKNLKLFRTVAW